MEPYIFYILSSLKLKVKHYETFGLKKRPEIVARKLPELEGQKKNEPR
jgi:hypothetical protein